MLLLRRFLPVVVAVANVACLFWQARSPLTYPWFAVLAPLLFVGAATFIGRGKRLPVGELVARMLPSALTLVACGYALLLAEGPFARTLLPVVGGVVSYLALELLFLLAFLPTRYPVNGLSRLNVALVPVVLWLVNYASVGLMMFVHASRAVPILTLAAAGALLFWATAHVDAPPEHRRRWGAMGGWLGAQMGLLGAFLPLQVALHGAYAAFLGAMALRTRRYGISPRPSRGLVWGETAGAFVLLVLMLATARWV